MAGDRSLLIKSVRQLHRSILASHVDLPRLIGALRFTVIHNAMLQQPRPHECMHPCIQVTHFDLCHGGRSTQRLKIFFNVRSEIFGEGREQHLLVRRRAVLGRPLDSVHCQHRFSRTSPTQHAYRATSIARGQFMLSWMQKDAPLRQRCIHDCQHGCVVVNHQEAGPRLWCVQGTGKVTGVDVAINASFAGAQSVL